MNQIPWELIRQPGKDWNRPKTGERREAPHESNREHRAKAWEKLYTPVINFWLGYW